MTFTHMAAGDLVEIAKSRSPFATDGVGGVDTSPATDPAGAWSKPKPPLEPFELLKKAGIYKVQAGGVLMKYTAPKRKPATKRGEVTREINQNTHMWAMLNDRELTPVQLAVGTRIAYYAFAPSSGGKCEKARATLADHCGISESTLRRTAEVLVERGYFQRADTGKGGRAGRGKSVYVPTLPSWYIQGVH